MTDYSGLSKEDLIKELHLCDDDIVFLVGRINEQAEEIREAQKDYWKAVQEHQADLQAIHDRQKRERDEFRILDRNTGELVILDELPADLSNAVTIEHRRVTDWQGVNVSEDEDVEGN